MVIYFTAPKTPPIGTVRGMTQAASPSTPASTAEQPKQPLAGWVEVFRAGTHTDSKGRKCQFSQADLDQMAANHALGAAPIVLGHPKDNDPAYGWADGYKREGDSLFARFADVNPAFADSVAAGAYRNRSVSVFKDAGAGWRVRHVGFLGAVPPAIDGLRPLQFVAPEADCYEFAEPGYSLVWGLESASKCLRGLRDYLIEKEGVEGADKVLPQWQIDTINESATQARAEYQTEAAAPAETTSFSTDPKGSTTMSQEQQDALTAAQEAKKAAEDKLAEFARASEAKDAELAALRKERQTERLSGVVEGLVRAGKVTPAQRAGMVEFMGAIEDQGGAEFCFSQGDGQAEAKKTPGQWFAEFAASLPVQVRLGKAIGDSQDITATSDPSAIAQKAREYMADQASKGVTVQLHDAIQHVSQVGA